MPDTIPQRRRQDEAKSLQHWQHRGPFALAQTWHKPSAAGVVLGAL